VIPAFYTPRPQWPTAIERIVELLGRVTAFEEASGRQVALRRANQIASVHSSAAIEGNPLTLGQVEDIANGEPVHAAPRAVREIENALAAYEALGTFDPWSVEDFLRAHSLLTAGLVAESGAFRTVDVDIVNADGDVLHTGSRAEKVPRLVAELLEWGSTSTDHPLVVSSAVHFLIEHIHPFRDGNGRVGRLWQTLILSRWRDLFDGSPFENLIRRHQVGYYAALQASREPVIDAAPFIDFMLDVITESLVSYEERAKSTAIGGITGGRRGGIKDRLLDTLRDDPTLAAPALAEALGVSVRTVERRIAALKAAGRLRRQGSKKSGQWVVVEEHQ